MDSERSDVLRFRTDEPSEFADFMSGVAPGVTASAMHGRSFLARTAVLRFPRSALFNVASRNFRVQLERPAGYIGLSVPMEGEFRAASGGALQTYSFDTAHVLEPGRPFEFQSAGSSQVLVANLFEPLIGGAVARLNGDTGSAPAALGDSVSMCSSAGSTLWRYMRFLWREGRKRSPAIESQLVARELESGLLATLVFAADKTRDGLLSPPDSHCGPVFVRRAEDFLVANVTNTVALADVSAAAGIPIRTLTRGFRDKHGVGPIEYLRKLRLARAYQDLLAADLFKRDRDRNRLQIRFLQSWPLLDRVPAGCRRETVRDAASLGMQSLVVAAIANQRCRATSCPVRPQPGKWPSRPAPFTAPRGQGLMRWRRACGGPTLRI